MPQNRPCVVIAGGPGAASLGGVSASPVYSHRRSAALLRQRGLLESQDGSVWRWRPKDEPGNLCVDVVGSLPRCMDMVTADEAIRRIETYFIGGAIEYLTEEQFARLDGIAVPNPMYTQQSFPASTG